MRGINDGRRKAVDFESYHSTGSFDYVLPISLLYRTLSKPHSIKQAGKRDEKLQRTAKDVAPQKWLPLVLYTATESLLNLILNYW